MNLAGNIVSDIAKAGVSAGAGAVAVLTLGGEAGRSTINLPIINTAVPAFVVAGVAIGCASLIADITHDFVLPHIQKSTPKWAHLESALLQIGIAGAGTFLVLSGIFGADKSKWMNQALLGAGSVMAGEYVYKKVLLGTGEAVFFS